MLGCLSVIVFIVYSYTEVIDGPILEMRRVEA